jgi:hypothetical protein
VCVRKAPPAMSAAIRVAKVVVRVDQIFTSWNRLTDWLLRIQQLNLRNAA